uniref:Uncharacterized protein n=1 Tax=Romanomermis culicivorax TaxID=13658 RepID=A0A915KKV1_ROMCU
MLSKIKRRTVLVNRTKKSAWVSIEKDFQENPECQEECRTTDDKMEKFEKTQPVTVSRSNLKSVKNSNKFMCKRGRTVNSQWKKRVSVQKSCVALIQKPFLVAFNKGIGKSLNAIKCLLVKLTVFFETETEPETLALNNANILLDQMERTQYHRYYMV